MKSKDKISEDGLKLVLQELKDNPIRKFNVIFALTSIVPFLSFFYLLTVKLSSIDALAGHTGLVLFLSIFISVCGFSLGYNSLMNIVEKVVYYAAHAKHSDQLKSTFVATVSHELKNPLAIIKTNICNMKDGLAGQVNQMQKDILDTCHDVVDRINRLINDLLDLHKIEAGVLDIKRRLCNLQAILERQIKEFEVMLSKKRIKFRKEILNKDLSLWADEDKIIQVVNNLLSNAIKYTPEEGTIELKILPADGLVRLEVTNTGEVIPQDKLEKIFDKFQRIDCSKEGTGLGLAITKDIVEMHKGKIWAESCPDKGNKFVVVLPCDLRKAGR